MKKLIFIAMLFILSVSLFGGVMGSWTDESGWYSKQYWLNYTCTTTPTTADSVVYTLPLDAKFNWNAPLFVLINEDGNTIDNATTNVILYQGYTDDFALSVTDAGVATITDGWEVADPIEDDVKASVGQVTLYGTGRKLADVADTYFYITPTPEIAFSIEGEALIAAEIQIRVFQLMDDNLKGQWMGGN